MAVELRADALTEVGGADGAGGIAIHFNRNSNGYLSPASRVIAVTVSSLLPAELDAVTVMV